MALTIADLFEHAADTCGAHTALVCGDQSLTYSGLDARSNRLASFFASRGIGAADKVAVYCRNSIECVEAMMAIYKLRAVVVNVNYRYVAEELRYILENSDSVAVVCEQRYLPTLSAALKSSAAVHTVVVVPDEGSAGWGHLPLAGESEATRGLAGHDDSGLDAVSYADALAAGTPDRLDTTRSGDDHYLLYTGGTTGMPKGVVWRQEDVFRVLGGGIDFYSGEYVTDEWEIARRGAEHPAPTRLPIPPMIHAASQWGAFQNLFAGGTVVLEPAFDPARVWQLIERHRVAIVLIAGDAIARPLIENYREGEHDASSLAVLVSTAALFSESVKHKILDAFPNTLLIDSIGSSETGFGGMTMVTKEQHQCGGPTVNIVKSNVVLDEDGRRLTAPGSVGRIASTGHIPLEYYKDPTKSAATFVTYDGVRYSLPGDEARIESDGSVTLLGRGSNCINSGGEKVFPEEVEGALKAHDDVFDVLVVGVDDDRLGQHVGALIQTRGDATVTLDGLADAARESLARYKLPRSVWIVDEIRRSPAGKPDYPWARRVTQTIAPTQSRGQFVSGGSR
jgi:acyl-CoA synthetase (AMP-forming)/AMP-acid ligase II